MMNFEHKILNQKQNFYLNPKEKIFHCILKKGLLFLTIFLNFFYFENIVAQKDSKLFELQEAISKETNDSLKAVYEMNLSRELHRKSHNENQEYKHAQSAVDLALKIKDTFLYAKALDNFGLLNRYHEQYNQSLALHIKAYNLVKNKKTDAVTKMIYANNAGVSARYNQKYDTAITYYLKALKLAEKENDLKNIAISSNGIGNTLVYIPGREKETLEYFERSLDAEKKRNNSLGVAMNYLSISDFYINQEKYSTAREYLRSLLKINEERNDAFGLAITDEFFGISYLTEGKNLEQAVKYFKSSLEKFIILNNRHKQAEIYSNLGNAYFKLGNLNLAENYYQNSLEISKELNQFGLITSNTSNLSEIFERKQSYKTALSYFRISKQYEDSIKLSDQNIKIEAITQEYDLEKKENQIQLLEKDKALQKALLGSQEEKLNKRRLTTILLGIAFILLLIIFALQYKNSQNKKKANARIMQEEKEKINAIYERNLVQAEILVTRLRVNPHFLFNSLNAITYLIQSEQNFKAIKYLKIFSRYTRMVLETSKLQVIPLKEELKLTRYYLLLEENRFEDDFTFELEGVDNVAIENIQIPPLLIQPFLENAIWHGLLLSQNEKKLLSINVEVHENKTQIIIDDNGVGRNYKKGRSKSKTHKSMGMEIVNERIELYNKTHSSKIRFNIIDKKSNINEAIGTQIIIELDN